MAVKTPPPSKITDEHAAEIQAEARKDPLWFIDSVLGSNLWSKQREVVHSVFTNRHTTVPSCHDAGKSFVAARAAVTWLMAYTPSKVIFTAPSHRQVTDILAREMRTAWRQAKIMLGPDPLKERIEIADDWYSRGFAAKDPDKFVGTHSPNILVIVDESAGVSKDISIAVDALLTNPHAHRLDIGNPTSSEGPFFEQSRTPGINVIKIPAWETPNFVANGINNVDDLLAFDMTKLKIVSGHLLDPQWVLERYHRWGPDSPMWQSRVEANFPSQGSNSLFPLNLLEMAATEDRAKIVKKGPPRYGVDPARYGSDRTGIAMRRGDLVVAIDAYGMKRIGEDRPDREVETGNPTSQIAGDVKKRVSESGEGNIFIDTIGLGAGVLDMLGEMKMQNIYGVDVSRSSADDSEQFANLRDEIYWNLHLKFKEGTIAIPDDEELIQELSHIHYKFTARGIKVQPKEEIRKSLGRSPDKADALALSFVNPNIGDYGDGYSTGTPILEDQPTTAGLLSKEF